MSPCLFLEAYSPLGEFNSPSCSCLSAVFFVRENAASQRKSNNKNGFPLAGIPPFLLFPSVAFAPFGAFSYCCPRMRDSHKKTT